MTTATLPPPCDDAPLLAAPPLDLEALTTAVAGAGVEAHEAAVAVLATAARRAGVCPTLVDALVDPTGSPVLRARAYGRVALALAPTLAAG